MSTRLVPCCADLAIRVIATMRKLLSAVAPSLRSISASMSSPDNHPPGLSENLLANAEFQRSPTVQASDLLANLSSGPEDSFSWTAVTLAQVLGLFLVAGLAEIGGGWLVWQAMRESKPWWWAAVGSLVLVVYGFIPTLQPLSDFGRLYAVYGGIFIGLSYLWGIVFDGFQMDRGDVIGSIVALTGVGIVLFWPREGGLGG